MVLMVYLVALHMLLAAVDLTRRGFCPDPIFHSAHEIVVDQVHYLNGYYPVGHSDESGTDSKVYIDGRRGPEIQWSDPRALYKELTRGRLRDLWASSGYLSKLPLPFFLSAVVHKASGGSIMAISLAPQLFVALLLFSVYGIGRRAGGSWLGLAAAVIASGYPAVYQLARTHYDALATTAMAAAVICSLVYSRGFTRLRICALAGITVYLSTLVSESVSGSLLIGLVAAGPFAMEYVRLIRRGRTRTTDVLRGMAGLALFFAPICLLYNWDRITAFILYSHSSWTEMSAFPRIGTHVPESLHPYVSFFAYFFRITFDLLQPMMTLWLVAGAVLLWRAPRGERLAVALSVAVPLVLQSVMPKKAIQYILPICPSLALITALGLRGLRSPKLRRGAMGVAAACGLMMPLFYTIIPPRYRDLVDLDQISPRIKTAVEIHELPLGDKRLGDMSHRTDILPTAIAGRELVAHDLKNNPLRVGPRRVAVFGRRADPYEGLRYVVELSHPEMFVLDFLNANMKRRTRWLMLEELRADQFDYLVFTGANPDDGLGAFPQGGWDPLKSRMDLSLIMRIGDDPRLWSDANKLKMMDGQSPSGQNRWNTRFRRFVKDLFQRRWKRVDLSVGPIYQAVNEG